VSRRDERLQRRRLRRAREVPWSAQLRILGEILLAAGPLFIGLAAAVLIASQEPNRASEAFYSAVSQVAPVLLLALALEIRVFGLRAIPLRPHHYTPRFGRWMLRLISYSRAVLAVFALFLLAVLELATLEILANEDYSTTSAVPFFFAFIFGLVAVAAFAVAPPRPE
jgi:hypothetical protein